MFANEKTSVDEHETANCTWAVVRMETWDGLLDGRTDGDRLIFPWTPRQPFECSYGCCVIPETSWIGSVYVTEAGRVVVAGDSLAEPQTNVSETTMNTLIFTWMEVLFLDWELKIRNEPRSWKAAAVQEFANLCCIEFQYVNRWWRSIKWRQLVYRVIY